MSKGKFYQCDFFSNGKMLTLWISSDMVCKKFSGVLKMALMTAKDIAVAAQVSPNTISRMIARGQFPLPDESAGKRFFWRKETVQAVIDKLLLDKRHALVESGWIPPDVACKQCKKAAKS